VGQISEVYARRNEWIARRDENRSLHFERYCWPIIPTVAKMLLNGITDVDKITKTVTKKWIAAGNPTGFLSPDL
jgi:hypothetical protein